MKFSGRAQKRTLQRGCRKGGNASEINKRIMINVVNKDYPYFSKFKIIYFKGTRKMALKQFFVKRYCCNTSEFQSKIVTLENMNQNLRKMEYAVRGPILTRALEIEREMKSGEVKPFTQVIRANLGDGQAMGQKPITFYRQVMALICYPHLMTSKVFPDDTVQRARELLAQCKSGTIGAYTESFGIDLIRKDIAESIKRRDKFDSNWQDIFLSTGASDGIKNVLKLVNEKIDGKPVGVMVPIPQYPLYTATIAEFGMELVGYYLDESTNWGLDVDELSRTFNEAKQCCNPRILVVINPGNPTGQVLTRENIEQVIKFAYTNRLVLLADEVYQMNVYAKDSEFHSLKKVLNEMGSPYNSMELASFMSCSKGFMGECGIRGGYCELWNFDPKVVTAFSKTISASLCPNTVGQCLMDCIVRPPQKGEPSYELFEKEKCDVLNGLKEKADMVYKFFNKVEGLSCNIVQGAMYAFPKIDIPEKAKEEAQKLNMEPDVFYCFQLLETTGICVVPGSGFKQQPGTYHFRTTILPPKKDLLQMLKTFEGFQKKFMKRYS